MTFLWLPTFGALVVFWTCDRLLIVVVVVVVVVVVSCLEVAC